MRNSQAEDHRERTISVILDDLDQQVALGVDGQRGAGRGCRRRPANAVVAAVPTV